MDINSITEEAIRKHIERLSLIGRLGSSPSDGFMRAGWSDEESAAIECIREYGESIGLVPRYDSVGNLFIRTPDEHEQVVQVGSHLDTVPEGGNYDGAAGIVAGIEAIRAVHDQGLNKTKGLELVVWRGEESGTFGTAYKGSRAAFGIAPKDMLQNKFRLETLEDAIKGQGYNPDCIRNGIPTISQEDVDRISAHIELHIEQGKRLEQDGIDIGNVTSIRGPARYLIVVEGEFDHSGATPMGEEYRRDANLAMSYMQVNLYVMAMTQIKDKGKDLVQTVGEINTNPSINEQYPQVALNALTKVSGFGYFTLDVRSDNDSFKDIYVSEVQRIINEIASEFGVNAQIIETSASDALESLSEEVRSSIDRSCADCGYSVVSMPSGAGHDAAEVAKQVHSDGNAIPTGMIFIPCRNGKSHCKEEYASVEAITKGARVLGQTLEYLS